MSTITLANGDTKAVEKVYPDGSYNCPWCSYGVRPDDPRCMNPACLTQYADAWRVQAVIDEANARQAEKDRRAREHERSMQRLAEEREARELRFIEALTEVREAGQCAYCFTTTYGHYGDRAKRIRHRDANHHETAA